MIQFIRIDDRLIHGQVATMWSRHIDTEVLLVANDQVASDESLASLQKMSAPKGIKLGLRSVEESIKMLDNKLMSYKVFVLVRNIQDAERVVLGVQNSLKSVNIGNLGFKEGYKNLIRRIFVNNDDLESLDRMLDAGVEVYSQMVPTDSKATVTKELIQSLRESGL